MAFYLVTQRSNTVVGPCTHVISTFVMCLSWCVFVMEATEDLFPVSQKLSSVCTAVEDGNSGFVGDDTVLADEEFEYWSQVCESSNASFDDSDMFKDDHVELTQSGMIPLVLYDDEVSSGDDSPDFSLGFFGNLMQSSGFPAEPTTPPSPPPPGPMSDAEWLQSQGIDFDPDEW